jgi:hypothetical protein
MASPEQGRIERRLAVIAAVGMTRREFTAVVDRGLFSAAAPNPETSKVYLEAHPSSSRIPLGALRMHRERACCPANSFQGADRALQRMGRVTHLRD